MIEKRGDGCGGVFALASSRIVGLVSFVSFN